MVAPVIAEIPTIIYIFGGATLVSLLAYVGLILVPALGSFGRWWEKAGAAFLSLFVLLTLAMIGIAVGLIIVRNFADGIEGWFS